MTYRIKVNYERLFETALVVLALILIIDQLWLFGIPFGPILPDLSGLDITQSPVVHHWMIGALILVLVFIRRLDGGKTPW